MESVVKSFQAGFRSHHPDVRFETRLMGTGTAMAGLYTSVADVAFMGRAGTAKEIMAFEWVFRYKPLGIEVMTGSLDVPGKSPALVVFVHKDNPISRLTLAQLDAIFGCEHLRGASRWGQLGLKGEWANQPIRGYGYDAETGTGSFFQQVALNNSRKWNWDGVKEFKDIEKPDGSVYDSGQQILDALSMDRHGIGVSNPRYVNPRVKPIALASQESYFQATKDNLIQRKYPLTRIVPAYINQAPDKPIDPKVKEFLRYILSREGQQDILRDEGYLPLNREALRQQLKKLE
jgi:phosphate transport system substrate-binding protein